MNDQLLTTAESAKYLNISMASMILIETEVIATTESRTSLHSKYELANIGESIDSAFNNVIKRNFSGSTTDVSTWFSEHPNDDGAIGQAIYERFILGASSDDELIQMMKKHVRYCANNDGVQELIDNPHLYSARTKEAA